MSKATNDAVAAFFRSQFPAFQQFSLRELHGRALQPNWHIDLIAEHCGEIAAGRCWRLLVNAPPKTLKSMIGAVALPAFMLGQDPRKHILLVAGSQQLAKGLMAIVGRIFRTNTYQSLFPRVQATVTQMSVRTRYGGSITCALVGQPIDAYSMDLIVIDRPMAGPSFRASLRRNLVNAWFDQEVRPSVGDTPAPAILVLDQRSHADDLSGHLARRGNFETIVLPALELFPKTYSFPSGRLYKRERFEVLHSARDTMGQLKRDLEAVGPFVFVSRYLQGSYLRDLSQLKILHQRYTFQSRGWQRDDPDAPLRFLESALEDELQYVLFDGPATDKVGAIPSVVYRKPRVS